jgi:hypothetical protein
MTAVSRGRSRTRLVIIGTSLALIRAGDVMRFGARALPPLSASFRIAAQGEVLRRLAGVAGGGSAIGRSLWQPQVRVLHRSLAVGLPRREQNVGPVGFGPPPAGL